MQVITEDDKVNCKLAQLNTTLGDFVTRNKDSNLEWVFEKLSNLNDHILTTKYLQLHHAELIGGTALHLAAINRNPNAFGLLLIHGADYTMKNNKNLTVLHEMIESDEMILEKCITDEITDHIFIQMVLSVHLRNKNFENPTSPTGLSHFHIACAANNVQLVKEFLLSGVIVDHAVKKDCLLFPGFTPLHFASRYCVYEVAKVLLSHRANLRIKNAQGMTPQKLALKRKFEIISEENSDESLQDRNEKILELLLEKESKDEMLLKDKWGFSHFHVACALKDSKIAESYLQKVVGINHAVHINSPLWPGYTALHFAAMCNIDTVKLLIKKGADISIKDIKGVTPFDICIKNYNTQEIYEIMSLIPICKNIMLSDGKTKLTDLVFAMRNSDQLSLFLRRLSKTFSICDSPLWPSLTPMHLAIIFSQTPSDTGKKTTEDVNLQILSELFERNSDMVHSQDVHQQTPLHLAFRLDKKPALNLLFTFIESHPDLPDHADEDGLSYLHIASFCNKDSLLKRILSIGGDVNACYRGKSFLSPEVQTGSTALHFAVANGSVQVARILMEHGADVYAKDANDMTPMHLLLLNADASRLLKAPNLRNSIVSGTGLSHLHVASWCGMTDVVERLLDNGANVNALVNGNASMGGSSFLKKYEGYSPLLMAFEKKKGCTVKVLLKHGADILVEDAKGKALLYSVLEKKHSQCLLGDFIQAVKQSEDVRIRLKVDTGMTALHIACLDLDAETIEKLINEGYNVNEQSRPDSPVFQGYTPLHIVMRVCKEYDVDEIVPLLVKKRADVTLLNSASKTAIHMAFEMFDENEDEMYPYLNSMLEAQRDFSVNPANAGGITHFHVACRIFNTDVVEKFLQNADVNINQPIDFFHDDFPGYTPLHLAASDALDAFLEQLNTVDLLLKYGANLHAEDANGDTPLHTCFRGYNTSECLDVFERIASAGADVNARNGTGNTPLYYFLDSDDVSVEGIKTLLRMGCHLNTFNSITEQGYMGEYLQTLSYEESQKLFSIVIVNFPQTLKIDDVGRTVIHNVVSDDQVRMSSKLYATFIEQLFKTGCDVDDQDKFGRTALHMAMKFYNAECISGLLLTGADININDINGKTAFAYGADTCTVCEIYVSNDGKCNHLETLEILAVYVKKLQLCGLDVNKQNEDLASRTLEKLKNEASLSDEFFKELETIKVTTIEDQSLTLFGFLSETGAVANYPRMSLVTRSAVNKFFSSNGLGSLRIKFPELAGILQLQYRKASARPLLIESARNAFAILIGFVLPEICSDCILTYLTNSELKSLIVSTI